MEKTREQQTGAEAKIRLVEQAQKCLQSGDYSRALTLVRGAAPEFANDAELAQLEKLAQDGVNRTAEANRLITESQELFAQQKSSEALQLLRKAYELDRKNSLARAILANALVEHAQSLVQTDWLQAETLTNQALAVNPAHPTANTIRNQIVERKKNSTAEEWVEQARKLQSAGDLFLALAWVAEGLAVHPDDAKLQQMQEEIQRDQSARRRRQRRGDLDDLRRMEREIDSVADADAKQKLAERIQGIAAKYWTDGEMLSIANRLLNRLGLAPQENAAGSAKSKGTTVIFHVPRPTAPKAEQAAAAAAAQGSSSTVTPSKVAAAAIPSAQVSAPKASQTTPGPVARTQTPPSVVPQVDPPSKPPASVPPIAAPESKIKQRIAPRTKAPRIEPVKIAETKVQIAAPAPPVPAAPAVKPSAPAAKSKPVAAPAKKASKSNSLMIVLGVAAAVILVTATFFVTRKHYAEPAVKNASTPAASIPSAVAPGASAVSTSAPADSSPQQTTAEPAQSTATASPDSATTNVPPDVPPAAESVRNVGSLVIVAGQDDAKVLLNGKPLPQLTRGGQLRLPNLEPKDYVVQVSKNGFQDPPQQKIRIRNGEQVRIVFSLVALPRMASLAIQGAAPGTTVLVDQTTVGTVQADGTLSVATVNPGDHTVELRKDHFKPRQFRKHFVAGATISVAGKDVALEAAPGDVKIIFSPADAMVAVAKGDLLKTVSSGVPLSLPAGTYTLTARTAERFTRSSSFEVGPGESKTLTLSLAPNGMSKFEDPGGWKRDKDAFVRKGGEFVLFGVSPTSGTFAFSGMVVKGHMLQWVLNYTDARNYVLYQMDENGFYRTVIRNGQKVLEVKVSDKGDKKSFRMVQIRVTPTEIVHQVKHGDSWSVVDRWSQPGTNLGAGKFGFYIPGSDQVAISGFAHYADLNIR